MNNDVHRARGVSQGVPILRYGLCEQHCNLPIAKEKTNGIGNFILSFNSVDCGGTVRPDKNIIRIQKTSEGHRQRHGTPIGNFETQELKKQTKRRKQ